jgi:TRAP-type C4-dicarboxylate transport system substrate-binding protein
MAVRVREAMAQIKEESSGRLDITLYTNSVLGGDTAMISQTIADALWRIWPYIGALVVALAIVAAIPWISIGFL